MTSRLDYHVGEDWQNEEGLLKEEGEDQDHLRYLPGDCLWHYREVALVQKPFRPPVVLAFAVVG